ncbi:DNA glycosylase [Kockovaella imperatae]|uniref:Endonuclease III homolog n=1 Tax=Kockovaella imperatae TaxID=4999 RepID=A0A1Y1UDV3_9TREE|nr:DNA glycosylase [Kockovaella imperatae]ORX36218.1 DNA glycosylase [Kockovaella imperatae]
MSQDAAIGSAYTTLRRSTRSVSTTSPASKTPLDLSKYAFASSSSSPKRVKKESPMTPTSAKTASTSTADASSPSTPRSSKRARVKLEPMTPETSGIERPPTPKSSSKKPMPLLALDKPHPAPPKWEEQYRLIERMRKGIIAPVDDMGCERPRTANEVSPKTLRFHVLISLMLSSQTKDAITSQAVTNLHQTLPGGLTAESLAAAPEDVVQSCINKVGFWRRKTEYIQDAARKLLEREGEDQGDVPNTLEGLCELKGVGPKMAFLALQCAWDINAGIGVDVHVHRITNRLRWHKPQTTNPEQTRLNLQSWLPSELHKPINPMLVGFGQWALGVTCVSWDSASCVPRVSRMSRLKVEKK